MSVDLGTYHTTSISAERIIHQQEEPCSVQAVHSHYWNDATHLCKKGASHIQTATIWHRYTPTSGRPRYLSTVWAWWSKSLDHSAVALNTTSQPAYTLRARFNSTHHEQWYQTHCSYIWVTGGLINYDYGHSYLQTVLHRYIMNLSLVNAAFQCLCYITGSTACH